MCGICGYVGIEDRDLVVKMADTLEHRGPDDSGFLHEGNVHLGHRRLSIIDLSGGAQPMSTPDGKLTIAFNGEIYNYRELRREMEQRGHRFETHSDTEVLLRLYEERGAAALQELNGMFAFAVYDRRDGSLFLARDRIGIKPLYYLDLPGRLLFASESKALHCYRDWTPTIDPLAIDNYLALRYVPGDRAMFNEIRRLPAGHHMTYVDGRTTIKRYWEPPVYDPPRGRSDADYEEELGHLMEASVKRRMISDVSLGAYLSGGLDSSITVSLMSQLSSAPVKTFSVGFDYEHDELNDAAALAKVLGCDHHEIACRAEDVLLLPDIVYHMDEPMGDAITIPMFQLSREAKKQVTVILTGEGGDEIFGGYLFHKVMWAAEVYRRSVPGLVRDRLVKPLVSAVPAGAMNAVFNYPAYLGERGKLKALDYLDVLDPSRMSSAYEHLISLFDDRDKATLYGDAFRDSLAGGATLNGHGAAGRANGLASNDTAADAPYLDRLLRLQFDHWLPDNMLLRADKVAMAHAIEARVPFLDHELVEFAMQVPPRLKLKRLVGKYILRKYGRSILPEEVIKRKKMPFYVPIENYFEQPAFQAMMDDLLSDESVRNRGLFRPEAIAKLRSHMHRREFVPVKQVFSLMVLELWFRRFA